MGKVCLYNEKAKKVFNNRGKDWWVEDYGRNWGSDVAIKWNNLVVPENYKPYYAEDKRVDSYGEAKELTAVEIVPKDVILNACEKHLRRIIEELYNIQEKTMEKEVIEIIEEIRIGNVVLEKGDKIEVLSNLEESDEIAKLKKYERKKIDVVALYISEDLKPTITMGQPTMEITGSEIIFSNNKSHVQLPTRDIISMYEEKDFFAIAFKNEKKLQVTFIERY